jgi:hypothetical protein
VFVLVVNKRLQNLKIPSQLIQLTPAFVRDITLPGVYRDAEVTGFRLVISTNSKRYELRTKHPFTKKSLRIPIGPCSELGLEEARGKAGGFIWDLKAGKYPVKKKDIFSSQNKVLRYLKIAISNLPGNKLTVTKSELKQMDAKSIEISETGDTIKLTITAKKTRQKS